MVSKKKILGVDFDDVLFHCDEALLEFHAARYGEPYSREERRTFDLGPIWNCSPQEVQRRLDEFTESEFHENANIVQGAHNALQQLNERYEIFIVTGRAETARPATIRWLEENLLGLYKEIHFTSSHMEGLAHARPKSSVLKQLGVEIFIEDAPHFALDVASVGIPVFLFDTPWNREETPTGAIRVHSWDEIVKRLMA